MLHDFNESPIFEKNMSFGEFLRKKRRLMGLNQTDFGKMLGLHQHTVSFYETGSNYPTLDVAKEILNNIGAELIIREKKDDR